MNVFVNNQLGSFPNGQLMIGASIVPAGDLLDSVIIINDITISEMTPVQLPDLLLEHDEVLEEFKK